MKYDSNYLQNHDIDWFCMINGLYIHVASAGGKLPEIVNDRDNLRNLQHNVFMANDIFTDDDILVNANYLNHRFNNDQEKINNYLPSFLAMAKKGFISLDRTDLNNIESARYHVVCMPNNLEGINLQNIGQIPEYHLDNFQIIEHRESIDLQPLL